MSPEEQAFLKAKLSSMELQLEEQVQEPIIHVNIAGAIKARIPQAFLNSLLYFKAIIHELEHSLQLLRAQKIVNDVRQLERMLGTDGEMVFLMEKDAMSIEWLFLQLAPHSLLEEDLILLPKLNLNPRYESAYKRMLEGSQLSLEFYLESKWAGGRYDESTAWIIADENMEALERQERRERLRPMLETLYQVMEAESLGRSNVCSIILTGNYMGFDRKPIHPEFKN